MNDRRPVTDTTTAKDATRFAIALVEQATPSERETLLRWARQLLAIRGSALSTKDKIKQAVSATVESKAVIPFVKILGREMKRIGWDERSLPARIGLSAAAFAALLFSVHGVVFDALGRAVGVPLWVVFGAG